MTGPCRDPAGPTIETGPIAAVIHNGLVIGVVNDGIIYVGHRRVIGKVPALPAATLKSVSTVSEAIVNSAIEAHGRTPISGVKDILSVICKGPVTRRPEETNLRGRDPRSGYPVIT
jgi:hypothetical protein